MYEFNLHKKDKEEKMEEKVYESQRGKVHYWIEGSGAECIVLIHGATMDHDLFKHQIDFFSSSYKVLALDVPFHGKSRPYENFTLENAFLDLEEILKMEKVKKIHIAGQSMGGFISQIYAFKNKVQSVCIIDSGPLNIEYATKFDMWFLSKVSLMLKIFTYKFLIKTMSKQITFNDESKEYAYDTLTRMTKKEIITISDQVYQGIRKFAPEKIKITVPMIIFYGEHDETEGIIKGSKVWAEKEGHILKELKNASHNANFDNCEQFNKDYMEFLQTIK